MEQPNQVEVVCVKTSMAKAILTDSQFWVPVAVLVIGILLLIYVR